MATIDPVLSQRLRADLSRLYGGRLKRLILYGSRARGEARENSDYDVAVVLDPIHSLWAESKALATYELQLLDETEIQLHAVPVGEADLQVASGFASELRRDGVDL